MIRLLALICLISVPARGQAPQKVDVSKMSDLEFANFLATGLGEDFSISFEGKKYAPGALLPLQASLLRQAVAGTSKDAKAFADFTQAAMAQCLALGLAEACALVGIGDLRQSWI